MCLAVADDDTFGVLPAHINEWAPANARLRHNQEREEVRSCCCATDPLLGDRGGCGGCMPMCKQSVPRQQQQQHARGERGEQPSESPSRSTSRAS